MNLSWQKYKLSELASLKTGKLDSNAAVENGEFPFFTCSPETYSIDHYAFDTSAILLAGNNATGVFPIKFFSGKFNCYQRTYVIECISPEVCDLSFLYFALQIQLKFLQSLSIGAATKFLTKKLLDGLKIPLPPLQTQQKIAHILSAYDKLIENNLKRIKLLEEMAQITYEEWFVRMKFPGHKQAVIDAETGLPEGWKVEKVGSLLAKIKTTTKIKSSEYLAEGKIPIVDQSRDFIAGYTNNQESILEIDSPLIIFGDHTRILKLIHFKFARGADGTQIILSKEVKMPQHLFYFSLLAIDLSNYHYARHFKFLKDSDVLVPNVEVAEKFEVFAKEKFEAVKNLRSQNQHLKEARDILLPRLMTGMIDVNTLDLPKAIASIKAEHNDI